MRVRLEEALTPEQKKEVDTWDQPHHSFSDHAFPSPSHDRVTIPVGHYDKGDHEDEIGEHLAKHGMEIHDYRQGLAKDKHGRLVKIGKALGKTGGEHLLEKFTGDPSRAAKDTGSDHVITISRHPHDVAGMTSSGHSWVERSCMNFVSGQHRDKLPHDVREGTHVAYYHHKDDVRMERPLARIALKPFTSQDGKRTILNPEIKTYGDAPSSFERTVRGWTDKHFGISDNDTNIYTRHKKVYDDSGQKFIGGLGSLANAQKLHGETGVRSILDSNEHKITAKHLDDLVPEYFEHPAIHTHPKLEQRHVDWILHNADDDKHGLNAYQVHRTHKAVLAAHWDKVSKNAIDHLLSSRWVKQYPSESDEILAHPNAPAHAIRSRIINAAPNGFPHVSPDIFRHKEAAHPDVHDVMLKTMNDYSDDIGHPDVSLNSSAFYAYASNNHLHHDDINDLVSTLKVRASVPQKYGSQATEVTTDLIGGLANNLSLNKEQAHDLLGAMVSRRDRDGTLISPFEATHSRTMSAFARNNAHKDPAIADQLVTHILDAHKQRSPYLKQEANNTTHAILGSLTKEHQHNMLTSLEENEESYERNHAVRLLVSSEHLHHDIRSGILEGNYGDSVKDRLSKHAQLTSDEQGKLSPQQLYNQLEHFSLHDASWDRLANHAEATVRSSVASNSGLPDHHLAKLLQDPAFEVRHEAVLNRNVHKHLGKLVEGNDKIGLEAVFSHGKDHHMRRLIDRAGEDSDTGAYITNRFAQDMEHNRDNHTSDVTPHQATKLAHAIVFHHNQGRDMHTHSFVKGLMTLHGEQPFWIMHQHAKELEAKSEPSNRDTNQLAVTQDFLASNRHTPEDILRQMKDHKHPVFTRRLASNPATPDDVLHHFVKNHPDKDTAWRAYREMKRRGVKASEPEARFESVTSKTRVYLLG